MNTIDPERTTVGINIRKREHEERQAGNVEYADYLHRMKSCRQFYLINIEPVWVPDTGDIEGFCHDEVVRQGHDPRVHFDGGLRIEWMLSAWNYALRTAQHQSAPQVQDVLNMGLFVEPQENAHGFRTKELYIAGKINEVSWRNVPSAIDRLFQCVDEVQPIQGRNDPKGMTADEFYLEYEHIHPFGDGNGRTGKIIHNWLLGTLEEPVLVADYFGGGHA